MKKASTTRHGRRPKQLSGKQRSFENLLSGLARKTFGHADEPGNDSWSLARAATKRLQQDITPAVLATPSGPRLYEDPLIDAAWQLASDAKQLGFASAAEGEDLNTRVIHWIPTVIPIVKGRLARNLDVLANREPSGPVTLPSPARLAVFGDGGYRGLAQRRVLGMIERCHRKKPFHAVIHLGDTYHGGNESEMLRHLVAPLSETSSKLGVRVFSLCGNHDLYAGPDGYLAVLSAFAQPGRFFALETTTWRIACLDSCLADTSTLRMGGDLDSRQLSWLTSQQRLSPKPLVVMSHHQPRSAWEKSNAKLLKQIGQISGLHAWYWGHEHRCTAYAPRRGARFHGGCVGNGAFLEIWKTPGKREAVEWFPQLGRCTCYKSGGKRYWPHGFLELDLVEGGLTETWHTEGVDPFVRNIQL